MNGAEAAAGFQPPHNIRQASRNLYNERPAGLDRAHQKLAAAVAAAYGWPADLTDEQILEKLPGLNLERAAAEAGQDEEAQTAKTKQPKTTRAKHADEMI